MIKPLIKSKKLKEHAAKTAVLMNVSVPVWIFDLEVSKITWANAAALEYWEAESARELYQRSMGDDMSNAVYQRFRQLHKDTRNDGGSYTEHWTMYPKGIPRTTPLMFSPWDCPSGHACLMVQSTITDETTESNNLRSMQALMHTSSMISLYDATHTMIYSNPAARDVATDDRGNLEDKFVEPNDFDMLMRKLKESGECQLETQVNTAAGPAWHALDIRASFDAVTGEESILISESDVSERRRVQEQVYELAYTDTLTGLPNRVVLVEHINRLIESSDAHCQFAVLFIDLDRFKIVNDSLGHSTGDKLLTVVAERLSQCVGERGIVSRLGGDDYVVVLNNVRDTDEVRHWAEKIVKETSEISVVSGHRLRVVPSIGVCLYPEHGRSSTELMQNADTAMYAAKNSTTGYRVFEGQMNHGLKHRLEIEADLMTAIRDEEFMMFYQPRLCVRTESICGFEALLRWNHPERGMVHPLSFIEVAEETGLILQIGEWVIAEAMHQQAVWQSQGHSCFVSINISPRQFDAGTLVDITERCIRETRCDPTKIEFEITESSLLGHDASAYEALVELNRLGIQLSIDDFGTGYSNLAYLHRYPLSCIKIDRTFLANKDEVNLLGIILQMGKLLDMKVVAEGVETLEQASWLRENGCDEYQGFLFAKPMPRDKASEHLEQIGRPQRSRIVQIA